MLCWLALGGVLQVGAPRPAAPDDAAPPTPPAAEPAEDKTHVNILGLSSTSGLDYTPLTGSERWQLFLKQTFTTPGAYAPVFATSIVAQWRLEPPEWEDGFSGYGKRAASAFGTNVVQGLIQTSGNQLLKQDPRFIRRGTGGFWRRTGHAALFTFFTYNDEGKTRPGLANLASFYGSNVIAVLWYPPGHDALREGVEAANIQMAMNLGFNILQEFWPDLWRLVKHPHRRDRTADLSRAAGASEGRGRP